ncbi:MAG: hypothetical protein K0R58_734, partial [Ramlibacter sp.]|nr:hypothetical protein [Ramlibacter sp.]
MEVGRGHTLREALATLDKAGTG